MSERRDAEEEADHKPEYESRQTRTGCCLELHVVAPVFDGGGFQSAAASVSPVRMRTALSSPRMKILPSPIWPVLAAVVMASTALSTWSLGTATSILILGRKLTAYSAPR